MTTEHAAAAKAIRSELKKNGVVGKVRARAYAGGSSVTVTLCDALPATRNQVEAFAKGYQYGHFDGMTDCYEYSNRNDDKPQVKFVFVEVEYSDEIKQEVAQYIDDNYDLSNTAPYYRQELAHRIRCGGETCNFWASRKPRIAAAA